MSIEDNIAARKTAEECIELILEWVKESDISAEAKRQAFDKVADMLDDLTNRDRMADIPAELRPMGDEEKQRFEAQRMKFGKHNGYLIGDIPLDYLAWLDAEQSDPFMTNLRRYLKHPDVWAQQATNRD